MPAHPISLVCKALDRAYEKRGKPKACSFIGLRLLVETMHFSARLLEST